MITFLQSRTKPDMTFNNSLLMITLSIDGLIFPTPSSVIENTLNSFVFHGFVFYCLMIAGILNMLTQDTVKKSILVISFSPYIIAGVNIFEQSSQAQPLILSIWIQIAMLSLIIADYWLDVRRPSDE